MVIPLMVHVGISCQGVSADGGGGGWSSGRWGEDRKQFSPNAPCFKKKKCILNTPLELMTLIGGNEKQPRTLLGNVVLSLLTVQ